ncbi:MAG: glycoside hydrolase family 88 protein [Rhodocyclaceae bacterium]
MTSAGLLLAAVGAQAGPLASGTVGVKTANYMMNTWPNVDDYSCGNKCFSLQYATVPATANPKFWEYTNGVPLLGVWKLYERTGNMAYFNYVKKYVDTYVDANGVINYGTVNPVTGVAGKNDPTIQDVIQPSQLLFGLYEKTKDTRYLNAMIATRKVVDTIKKNSAGAFWHKPQYANQQWLDGIYMTQPFLVRYARQYGDKVLPGDAATAYNIATNQIKLAHEHTFNAGKLLHYHGWNGAEDGIWLGLDGVKGKTSPLPTVQVSQILWSRSIAWYFIGIVDTLEYLPKNHPDYKKLYTLLSYIADGLTRQQDSSGLWWQVIDVRNNKLPANGGYPGENIAAQPNFLETSASAYFAYGFAKAARLGLLDDGAKAVAKKAWAGVKSRIAIDGNNITIKGTVVGMSLGGTFNAYTNVDSRTDLSTGPLPAPADQCTAIPPRGTSAPLVCKFVFVRENVPQGIGAVLYAASELEF